MRPCTVPVLLALGLAGCESTTPPERPAPYPYAIVLNDGTLLSFHWPAASLPVRVWAEPDGVLREWTHAAIQEWEQVGLYGEFTGVLVGDSTRADVLVRRGEPFASNRPHANDCSGATSIKIDLDTAIVLPFVILLSPRIGAGATEVDRCLALFAVHELGHALGLFLHSDDPSDLMHVSPSFDGLSSRDRATFNTLYHSPVSVRLPAGR